MYECPVCKADPTSHSLVKLTETDDMVYYYTRPAKASKYNDREGILSHYNGELTQKGTKPWTWIFDCAGFDMRHAIEIRLAIDMAKLITKSHGDSLKKGMYNKPNHIYPCYCKCYMAVFIQSYTFCYNL